jgi:hypothetical protein
LKDTARESNSILLIILIAVFFLNLRSVAPARDDPIGAEKLCRNEVIQKYSVVNSNVKVIFRGDDGDGHHIVNFDVALNDSKTNTGICLVRKLDNAIETKEFIEFPREN